MIVAAAVASLSLLQALPLAAAKLKLQRERATANAIWKPNPGAQQLLLHLVEKTKVEEIWFLGEAGGGKTWAALGLTGTHFQNAIFFRRELADLKGAEGAIERSRTLYQAHGSFNAVDRVWRLLTGGKRRFLEFAGCEREDDKFSQQGRPHDLYVFDEITHFTPTQPAYIVGWKRSADPTQRTLELYLGNPPMTAEGEWVTERVRPWVDPTYPRPAAPGEIRYFVERRDGSQLEVDGPEPLEVDGETRRPKSRTYVPSVLQENPTYANGEYARTLDAMPEPMRSILMRGDFLASRKDSIWQVIPSAWVKAAQARWKPRGYGDRTQDQVGMDVAHGGADNTVRVERRGLWFGMPLVTPGKATPDGFEAADLLAAVLEKDAFGVIDANGVGASCYDIAKKRKLRVTGVTGSEASTRRDRSRKFAFVNQRAALHWYFRELLDPSSPTYLPVALPPHPHVLADLTAPTWKPTLRGIQVEAKADVKKRIGRSPDVGDAVLLASAPWLAPIVDVGAVVSAEPSPFADWDGATELSPGRPEAWL